jgi:hypothetical protein
MFKQSEEITPLLKLAIFSQSSYSYFLAGARFSNAITSFASDSNPKADPQHWKKNTFSIFENVS